MIITEQQRKRFEDFDAIIDAVKVANDTNLAARGMNYDMRNVVNWCRTLSDETLHVLRTMMDTVEVRQDWRGNIFPGEFIMGAAYRNIGDHEAALAAFIHMSVDSAPWDVTGAAGKSDELSVDLDNAISRVRVIQDTILFSHRNAVPEELYVAVIHGKITNASEVTKSQIKSIIEVTQTAWQHESDRNQALDKTRDARPSVSTIKSRELFDVALKYADRIHDLCYFIKTRESSDPSMLVEVMESSHSAMAVGQL